MPSIKPKVPNIAKMQPRYRNMLCMRCVTGTGCLEQGYAPVYAPMFKASVTANQFTGLYKTYIPAIISTRYRTVLF